eukprot:scaffold83941_cov33-Phaeocystis_antarctica.AAC.2
MVQLTKRAQLELELEELRATWNPTPFLESSFSKAQAAVSVREQPMKPSSAAAAATARKSLRKQGSAVVIERRAGREASQSFAK